MKKNRNLWILVAVAVVVLVIVWLAQSNSDDVGNVNLFGNKSTVSPSPSVSSVRNIVKPKATSIPSVSNYSQLVKEYGSRRLQFDERCQMTPVSPTFKNGTKIMLDNRSGTAKTISVDAKNYQIIAYGYQVITLSGSSLPRTMAVNCGSSVNVGRILLQATILNQ